MTSFIQSCAVLFNDILNAMWTVEYFRLPFSLLFFLAVLGLLLLSAYVLERM